MNNVTTINIQRGLTLVELMVALALSLVLMGGAFVLFSANKTTYQMQEGVSLLQESGRYAINQIRADLQKAGYGGCLSPQDSPVISVLVSNPPAYLDAISAGSPISGQDDVSTVSVGGKAVLDGTDVIDIRGPLRSSMSYVDGKIFPQQSITVTGNSTGFATNEYLMIADCGGADIFRASSVTPNGGADPTTVIGHDDTVNTLATLSRKFGADSVVMELFIYSYFIADTGRTSSAGDPILALYREDGSNNPQEILEGVENLQITYGLDTDADNEVDSFLEADAVSDWSEVVDVRVSLLVNSVEASAQTESDYIYLPVGSTSVSPDAGDYRMRQEFASVINLRNAVM